MSETHSGQTQAPGPTPNWEIPTRYGYAAAIESMGSVASPFLAGIGIALVTLVLSSEGSFGRPSASLFLLVGATLAFIGAVQCSFWARSYLVVPAELHDWWGDALKDPDRLREVEAEQLSGKIQHEKWAHRARMFYDAGIALLLLAVPVLLVPPGGLSHATDARLATFSLALLGFVVECLWILASQRWLMRRSRTHSSQS